MRSIMQLTLPQYAAIDSKSTQQKVNKGRIVKTVSVLYGNGHISRDMDCFCEVRSEVRSITPPGGRQQGFKTPKKSMYLMTVPGRARKSREKFGSVFPCVLINFHSEDMRGFQYKIQQCAQESELEYEYVFSRCWSRNWQEFRRQKSQNLRTINTRKH